MNTYIHDLSNTLQFDTEDAYSVILYGSSALVLIWLTSTIVSAIDSIPLVSIHSYLLVNLELPNIILKLLIFIPVYMIILVIFHLMNSVSQVAASCGSWLHILVQHPLPVVQGTHLINSLDLLYL